MKKIKFYYCENCGNILTATGETDITCCGRKLSPLVPKPLDDNHQINVETVEDDYYITFAHDMTKQHYFSFAIYMYFDRFLFIKLYPEQASEVRFPKTRRGKLYLYCTNHGFMEADLK